MDINKSLQINTFTKGMDTDTSDMYISNERYRYAENVRVTTNTESNSGELHLVEGVTPINILENSTTPDYNGLIISFDSVRDLGVIVTVDGNLAWSVYTFNIDTKQANCIISHCEEHIWPEDWDLKIKPISTVLKYEAYNNIKLYIADGIHNLMEIPLVDEDGNPLLLSNNFDELFSYDKLLLPPPTVNLSKNSGLIHSAIVLYAYRLYKKHAASSTLSGLSKPVSLYKTASMGYASDKVTNCAVDIYLPDIDSTYLNRIEIYRINFLKLGLAPVIDLIYDGKRTTKKYTDTGSSIKTITVEDLLSMYELNIHPSVIESKNNYLFAGNVEYGQEEIDETFSQFDARIYSTGNYILDENDSEISIFKRKYSDRNYLIKLFSDFYDDDKKIDREKLKNYQFPDSNLSQPGNTEEYAWAQAPLYISNDAPSYGQQSEGYDPDGSNFIYRSSVSYTNGCESGIIGSGDEYYNGIGPNFAWKYIFTDWHSPDENDKSNPRRTYRRGEIYRFGVRLFTKDGKSSSVKWMCDIFIPYVTNFNISSESNNINQILIDNHNKYSSEDLYNGDNAYQIREIGIEFFPIIRDENKNLWENIYGYEIVRCEKTLNDSYVVAQGIVGYPTRMYNTGLTTTDIPTDTGELHYTLPNGVKRVRYYIDAQRQTDTTYSLNTSFPSGFITTDNFYITTEFASEIKSGTTDPTTNKVWYHPGYWRGMPNKNLLMFACPEYCYLGDDMKDIIQLSGLLYVRGISMFQPNSQNVYSHLSEKTSGMSEQDAYDYKVSKYISAQDDGGFDFRYDGFSSTGWNMRHFQLEPVRTYNKHNTIGGYEIGTNLIYTVYSNEDGTLNPQAERDYYINPPIMDLNWGDVEPQLYKRTRYYVNSGNDNDFGSYENFWLDNNGILRNDLGLGGQVTKNFVNEFAPKYEIYDISDLRTDYADVTHVDFVKNPSWDSFSQGDQWTYTNAVTQTHNHESFINWSAPLLWLVSSQNSKQEIESMMALTNVYGNSEAHNYQASWGSEAYPNSNYKYVMYPIGAGGKLMLLNIENNHLSGSGTGQDSTNVTMPSIHIMNLLKHAQPYGGYNHEAILSSKFVSYGNYVSVNHENNNVSADPIKVFDGDTFFKVFSYNALHDWYSYNYPQWPKMTTIYMVPIETSIDLLALWSSYSYGKNGFSDYHIQDDPAAFLNYVLTEGSYLYNTAYNSLYGITKYITNEDNEEESSVYDTRVHYSDIKTNGENIDSWLSFRAVNFIDVDSRHGKLTDLKTFKDKLIFWQDRATGILSVNERTLLKDTESSSIILGNGGVLDRYDYFTTVYGMKPNQFAKDVSNDLLYWWDGYNKEIIAYKGGYEVDPLSTTKNIKNYINSNDESDTPAVIYDGLNKEVLFNVVNNEAVVYGELVQAFTSVYTFCPVWHARINEKEILADTTGYYTQYNTSIYEYNSKTVEYKFKYVSSGGNLSYLLTGRTQNPNSTLLLNSYYTVDELLLVFKPRNSSNLTEFFNDDSWKENEIRSIEYYLFDSATEIYIGRFRFMKCKTSELANYFNNSPVLPKLEYVVNSSSEMNKVFDIQTFGGRFYGGATTNDNGEYTNDYLSALHFNYKTPLKQNSSADGNDFVTVVEYDYRLTVPRNNNDFYGGRMRGKTMLCELSSDSNTLDFSILYITTKFRISWS